MKLTAAVIMMAATAMGAMAAGGREAQRNVTVCAELGSAGPVAYAAQVEASAIFAKSGVHMNWRAANACADPRLKVLRRRAEGKRCEYGNRNRLEFRSVHGPPRICVPMATTRNATSGGRATP